MYLFTVVGCKFPILKIINIQYKLHLLSYCISIFYKQIAILEYYFKKIICSFEPNNNNTFCLLITKIFNHGTS